ncbi:MAG: phosphatidylglycerophosphatase A [Planctomycetota bacterium]|nr:MAG: phosphatidylglycerophosphatase A [Planctomycetota bacterium]
MSAGRRAALAVLSAFGLGYSPWAPGTAGTLLGVLQFVALGAAGAEWALAPLALLWFGLTWWLAPVAIARYGVDDPQQVVSDEVAGLLVALVGTGSLGLGLVPRAVAGFALFRLFDIAKPGPVRWAERCHGGLGIALDDVVAGLLANACLQIVARLAL